VTTAQRPCKQQCGNSVISAQKITWTNDNYKVANNYKVDKVKNCGGYNVVIGDNYDDDNDSNDDDVDDEVGGSTADLFALCSANSSNLQWDMTRSVSVTSVTTV
jgi:hypothetical protein